MNWTDSRIGVGNWAAFPSDGLDELFTATDDWKVEFIGVENPWLCWCVDDEWCTLQQRLVHASGWTPVVGTDGRTKQPNIIHGAHFIDFNKRLQLPVMWMHFPLEFVFRYTQRLAFWHSDVLPPIPIMKSLAKDFDSLQPDEYLGVRDIPTVSRCLRRLARVVTRRKLHWLWNFKASRWFEVVGCISAGASQSQFDSGCGIWRNIHKHPNATSVIKSSHPLYDHGVGVKYWETKFHGRVRELSLDIHKYHYPTKGKHHVINQSGQVEKGIELRKRYDPERLSAALGLTPGTEVRN